MEITKIEDKAIEEVKSELLKEGIVVDKTIEEIQKELELDKCKPIITTDSSSEEDFTEDYAYESFKLYAYELFKFYYSK